MIENDPKMHPVLVYWFPSVISTLTYVTYDQPEKDSKWATLTTVLVCSALAVGVLAAAAYVWLR